MSVIGDDNVSVVVRPRPTGRFSVGFVFDKAVIDEAVNS